MNTSSKLLFGSFASLLVITAAAGCAVDAREDAPALGTRSDRDTAEKPDPQECYDNCIQTACENQDSNDNIPDPGIPKIPDLSGDGVFGGPPDQADCETRWVRICSLKCGLLKGGVPDKRHIPKKLTQ